MESRRLQWLLCHIRCTNWSLLVCFAGITITSAPNTFVNINPDHIGFYRVNYDSQSWATLSTLLVNNHSVSVITLTQLVGVLQRSIEAAFPANNLSIYSWLLFPSFHTGFFSCWSCRDFGWCLFFSKVNWFPAEISMQVFHFHLPTN